MRIAYPVLWSRLGRDAGQEQTVSTVAALARAGVEITLLVPRALEDPALSEEAVRDWFSVRGDFGLVQRPSRWAGENVVRTTLWMRQATADPLLAGFDLLYSRAPVMIAWPFAVPIPFATDHYRPWPDEPAWRWLRPFIRRTAATRHCLGYVSHSAFAAESYARIGVPREKLLVAHNGVDLDRRTPPLGKAKARARLALSGDRPIAVYAGRINPSKGLDQILALADLRPDTLFLLVGSEGEGAVEQAARLRANVRVVPWQEPDALPAWLAAADILLIPPSSAPLRRFGTCVLPMKTFSYLAAGRPILAPRSPDTAELLRDGDNALLVAPDSPNEAAKALDRLSGDSPLAAHLAARAAETAESHSWDARAARIVAFLQARLADFSASA
ncbi:MAG: glycosyltransferase family 4 protein [Allosphingosinicella sp.]